jgi:cob(I)alamin adenosyltransferase
LYVVDKLPGLTLEAFGRGKFVSEKKPDKVDIDLASRALAKAQEITKAGEVDVLILDEINVAVNLKLIDVKEVLELIGKKPEHMELVLTGRKAPVEIVQAADLVTEMIEIKHPYNSGFKARKGIEY